MGSRGAYSQRGGFSVYKYEAAGETIEGFKVIRNKTDGHASLPQMSNTPGTVYILQNGNGRYKSMGVYGEDRRLRKQIDIDLGHTNRYKSGKRVVLKKGVAHVHNWRGGRDNNVRYMTKKEIKKYGRAIIAMGGKLYE